ncbi:MAG: response regulator [Pseudomonadota bacterium]
MPKPYILIVDDDPVNHLVLQLILEDDFEEWAVNNGQECLQSLHKRIPDLILMDIEMPVLNGIEACKKIRANKHTLHIPIIFISSRFKEKDIQCCFYAGGNAHFTKPVNKKKLIQRINLLLGKQPNLAIT